MATWVSPTGFIAGAWINEANSYDGSIVTYASASTRFQEMELTIAAINCSKIRIWSDNGAGGDADGKIEVYYSGAYHIIHDGLITNGTWVEVEVGSTESITGTRLTLQDFTTFRCYEFEFWEASVPGTSGSGSYFSRLEQWRGSDL